MNVCIITQLIDLDLVELIPYKFSDQKGTITVKKLTDEFGEEEQKSETERTQKLTFSQRIWSGREFKDLRAYETTGF